jgi:ferritin-like metal-binding protein YciE
MTPDSMQEQLTKYLTDAHAIEVQALMQMRAAPDLAGTPALAEPFERHLDETAHHEDLIRERLQARGAKPAVLKDLVAGLTGKGFTGFAAAQPDTPGKLVAHAFSYEHMELAAYELIADLAAGAGDGETEEVALGIAAQERAMAERLAASFDLAAEASLREVSPDDLRSHIPKYLADAHAIEAQSAELLERAPRLAGATELAQAYEDHLAETEEHKHLLAQRLQALGEDRSSLKDAALRLGALNWGAFFRAQPDTPAKLAAFAFAFEHLEIAAYELLERIGRRAGNPETADLAERILAQEREAAERIHGLFGAALEASLREQGVGAR